MMHSQPCKGMVVFPVELVLSGYHASWWRKILHACLGALPNLQKKRHKVLHQKTSSMLCCAAG